MENQSLTPKQAYMAASLPYQAWTYTISVPLVAFAAILANIFMKNSVLGTIVFVYAIFSHIRLVKLDKLGKGKYVGPILIYVANGIGFLGSIAAVGAVASGIPLLTSFGIIALVTLPIEIVAFVFFFITASQIKAAYPTMKEDAKLARATYKEARKKK